MIRQICSVIIAAAVLTAGCHSQKPITGAGDVAQQEAGASKLKVHMASVLRSPVKDSVMLSFTVINNTNQVQQFCKWETPFEPRLGKYFEVKDDQGNEALFKGAMARRVMPPPQEAYIQVPAHDSVRTVINLAHTYTLTADKYTIAYTGGGVSGINAGNVVKVIF
jgi:hypothetical protein